MKKVMLVFTIFNLIAIVSCVGEDMSAPKTIFPFISDISEEKWKNLSNKKIYFGHQSVGLNIIDGIKDVMKEHPEIKLNIIETASESDLNVGILAHSRVGKNSDAVLKINEFVDIIDKGIGSGSDAIALKFCYLDMNAGTDVKDIFSEYSSSAAKLKNSYPDMQIIHFTEPLTVTKTKWKTWLKKVMGKKDIWEYDDNIKRNQYNNMIIKRYQGKEPIFDIAKIQSTYPDGTRFTFSKAGETYYAMVPEYTDDGGHLNELGRKKVAEQFLIFLADI